MESAVVVVGQGLSACAAVVGQGLSARVGVGVEDGIKLRPVQSECVRVVRDVLLLAQLTVSPGTVGVAKAKISLNRGVAALLRHTNAITHAEVKVC